MKEKFSICKVCFTIWAVCSMLSVMTAVAVGITSQLFFYEVWAALLALSLGSVFSIGEKSYE